MGVVCAFDDAEEAGLELLGDGSECACSDRSIVDLADGRYFGGCACEECFGSSHMAA